MPPTRRKKGGVVAGDDPAHRAGGAALAHDPDAARWGACLSVALVALAETVKKWLEASGVGTLYIEPGSPWENAYTESFNGRFGDELLKREEFASVLEAKVLVEEYREHYNHRRPHSALGYRTPLEFAASCVRPIPVNQHVTSEEHEEELESTLILS